MCEEDGTICCGASAKRVRDLSGKFPCTSGVSTNLLCFAGELLGAAASLPAPSGDGWVCALPLAFGGGVDLGVKPGKSS